VVGVVVIVLLVVHLTKTGSPSGASSGSTSSTGASGAGAGAAPKFVFTAAPKAGSFKLNAAASRMFASQAQSQGSTVAAQIKAKGAGKPGKDLLAVYDLGTATTPGTSSFRAAVFYGYDGTFIPAKVIAFEKTQLVSTRMVPAGPNGGEMMCGYNRSTGTEASECVWVTTSTFGEVEFIVNSAPVKYKGAADIALTIRQAVEVPQR
jgi:hypothetical protein